MRLRPALIVSMHGVRTRQATILARLSAVKVLSSTGPVEGRGVAGRGSYVLTAQPGVRTGPHTCHRSRGGHTMGSTNKMSVTTQNRR
jgi:hypothetical protein